MVETASDGPLVLFVSKPIAAPFHDGTKCLVRDVAAHLRRHRVQVMTTPGTTELGVPLVPDHPGVRFAAVYATSGSFTPAISANLRAAAWLIARSRAQIWHFAFAPNPRTSAVGRLAKSIRRVKVVQTVASPPRLFLPEIFFADIVVAQSRWTRDRIEEVFRAAARSAPRVEVIPPPVGPIAPRSADQVAEVRAALGLESGSPVFVYPGDLEVSQGAETVARAIPEIVNRLPRAVVVFACRFKTARAPAVRAALERRLDARHVRFVETVDIPALLLASTGVLFPVDDLTGKVDLPIALLEAMRLGAPIVTLDEGPLRDLDGVLRVPGADPAALAAAAVGLVREPEARARLAAEAMDVVTRRFDVSVVAGAYERLYDELLR